MREENLRKRFNNKIKTQDNKFASVEGKKTCYDGEMNELSHAYLNDFEDERYGLVNIIEDTGEEQIDDNYHDEINKEQESLMNNFGIENLNIIRKKEKEVYKKNAKLINCNTLIKIPFACPDCKKKSLYGEPISGLIIRDGILALVSSFGVTVPSEYYSMFFCCVNQKCKSFYRNTGTKFYFDKNTGKLKKIKNYFYISR